MSKKSLGKIGFLTAKSRVKETCQRNPIFGKIETCQRNPIFWKIFWEKSDFSPGSKKCALAPQTLLRRLENGNWESGIGFAPKNFRHRNFRRDWELAIGNWQLAIGIA